MMREIDQIIRIHSVLTRVTPELDRMIGVHALDSAMDMDETGDVPYYSCMQCVMEQIIFNHSASDSLMVSEVLGNEKNSVKDIRKKLGITDVYINEDDCTLIEKNRTVISAVTEAISRICEIVGQCLKEEWV